MKLEIQNEEVARKYLFAKFQNKCPEPYVLIRSVNNFGCLFLHTNLDGKFLKLYLSQNVTNWDES